MYNTSSRIADVLKIENASSLLIHALKTFQSEFHAYFNEKDVFSKFSIFQVNIPFLNIEFNFEIFQKLRGQKKTKFRFFGSVFDAKKYGHRIFPKF